MTRYALKRFGKQAVKNNVKKYVAAKVGARVAGDEAGAATMAATTGVIRTAADATERMNGQVMYGTDAKVKVSLPDIRRATMQQQPSAKPLQTRPLRIIRK